MKALAPQNRQLHRPDGMAKESSQEPKRSVQASIGISRLCLIALTAAVLTSLVSCSSGGSGNSGGSGSTGGNSAPSISSISPQNASAGSTGFTLTVNGTGFVSTSAISWNGVNLATTGSSTQLTATVPPADVAAVGLAQITVVNPASNGGTSSPVGFIVNGVPGFVYVANATFGSVQTGSISAFSVDPNTGSLTLVSGSPFAAGANPTSLTVDPTGKFLYEVNDKNGATTNNLFAFTIDPSTGFLTPIAGSPFASGANTLSATIDPTGKFLYTADSGGDSTSPASPTSISVFSINPTTGVLLLATQVSARTPTSTDLANYVVTDPAAAYLFASTALGSICSFSIGSTGTPQAAAGSPVAVTPAGQSTLFPRSVTVDPFGKFLYTADGEVSGFSIASDGRLTPVSGSPYMLGSATAATSVLADPLGRFLWVDHGFTAIDCFSIDSSTGVLSLLGFPLTSPNPYIAITTSPATSSLPMAADPSGKFLYVLTQPGNVAQNFSISGFAIDPATGRLTLLQGSPLTLPLNTTPATVLITSKAQ